MALRYDIKQIDEDLCSVVHVETGEAVELNGSLQIGLDLQGANALVVALDLIADAKDARVPISVT